MEVFGKFSPDGKWIAFTGQYDGDEQVYVIPATGGEPKQLTFLSGKRTAHAALGLRQSGDGLDERRAGGRFSLAERFLRAADFKTLHRADDRRNADGLYRCPKPVRAISRRTAEKWFIRRAREIFAAKNATAADRRTRLTYTICRRMTRGKSAKACALGAMRCGSATRFILIRTRTANLIYTVTMFRRAKQLPRRNFKDWEVRWASSDDQSRVIYERNGELEILDTKNNKPAKLKYQRAGRRSL